MTLIHYVGSSDTRTIFASNFAANGVNDQGTTLWNEGNAWQVNVSTGAGTYLLTLSDFSLTGIVRPGTGGGPPGPPPSDQIHPNLASHDALGLATQAELDAAVAGFVSGSHPNLAAHDGLGLATQAELDTANASIAALPTTYVPLTQRDANSGYAGLAAAQGTRNGTKFLRDDGTWQVVVSGGGGTPLAVQDEGTALTARTTLNFVGAGVVATDDVAGTRTTVTIAGSTSSVHPNLAAHDSLGLATQTELDAKLALAGGNMTGSLFLPGDAATALQALPKQQLDAAIAGLSGTYTPKSKTVTVLTGTGIDETGVTDSTTAIQTLVTNALGPVEGVPGATYKISSVNLKNGSVVRANGASLICTVATPIVAGEGGGAFVTTGRTNVSVSGWTASGNTGTSLLKMVGGSVVRCLDNTVTDMQVFQCNSANGNVYLGSSETENFNILVMGNRGSAPASSVGTAGIFLLYCSDAWVINNHITGYTSCVQYWGGDANSQGVISNARKCKRIWMTLNRAIGAYGGGLWGSMGQDIHIIDNQVSGCGDIGIDFEGSFNCRASLNTVFDSFVANFGTFFRNRDIVFDNNTSIATSPSTCAALFIVKNATTDASKATGNGTITISNNTAYFLSGVSFAVFAEACEHLIVAGNKVRGGKFWNNIANSHNATITDNTMRWDGAAAAAFTAIDVGLNRQAGDGFAPRIVVNGNSLISEVAQPAGSIGVYNTQNDPNSSPVVEINRNSIVGFPTDISSQWGGTNVGTAAVVRISHNVIGSASGITITNTGATNPQLARRIGNRLFGGGEVRFWGAPTMLNSWIADVGLSYPAVGYTLTSDGELELRGAIRAGTSGTVAFTLPVGYRPITGTYNARVAPAGTIGTVGTCMIQVDSSGNVRAYSHGSASVTDLAIIDGLTFPII